MNNYSGFAITQQMYTRERRGIYRSTEGFDTVAKSERLDNNFVKKILHPFCVYDAPAELAARGEKDEARYPAALHLFHPESGETVVGRSSYQAADFTGQRSAFFAHNFVVPAARGEEILRQYGDWLHADFAAELTGEPGTALPELASIPVGRRGTRREAAAVLQSLGIGENMFKNLLQAVMTAVAGKKKIYVALDVPIAELTGHAVELTEILYSALPYEFRRRLGVITYANEPKSRKYIHLTFVEKGALRPGDRSIEKDFIFDLASGRTANVEFEQQRQPFADFVWKALASPGAALEDFAVFADGMLGGEDAERRLSLAAYNELAVFYEIEQGDERLYEENKSAVLSGLLSYLKLEGALDSKIRLNDLFLERFDREFDLIRQKGILVPAIMESFRDYYLLKGHTYQGRIVDYFINGMLNSQAAGQDQAVKAAYGIIECSDELSRAFFTKLLSQQVFRKTLFEPYVEARLAAAGRPADIVGFVISWGRFLPEALQQPFVREAVREYLLEKLKLEKDSVASAAAIHNTVQKAEKERRKGSGISLDTLALLQMMAAAADRFLLNQLSLDEISQEQLLEVSFVRYPEGVAEWTPPLDYVSKRKAKVLRTAYRWFGEEGPDEHIFSDLAPQELDDVQLLGRRWLKQAAQVEPFERLPLAFYYSSSREGGPLDYDALLELIRSKPGFGEETMYRFLAWSQGRPLFSISNKKLQPGYRRAILKYFLSHDREAFKNRDFRKSYVAAAGPALQNVYNEARAQLASPLAKWVRRSRFQLMISGSLLGIILILVLILLRTLGSGGEDTALPNASPQPTVGQSADMAAAVYLRNTEGGSGEEERQQLLFTFAAVSDCSKFNPAEVSIESSDGITNSYKVTAVAKSCVVTSATSSPDPAETAGSGSEDAVNSEDKAGADQNTSGESSDSAGSGNTANTAGSADETNTAGSANDATSLDGASAVPNTAVVPIEDSPFRVAVTLESKAALVKGNIIKAGGYTLTLMAEPAEASAGSLAGASAEPTASAETEAGPSPSPAGK